MKRGKFILVCGGARSGKSTFAERLVAASRKKVIYLATATANDEEMAYRIKQHKARRPSGWKTVEEPLDIAGVIAAHNSTENFILIDCLTLYLSNLLLLKNDNQNTEQACFFIRQEARILNALQNLCAIIDQSYADIVIVTNEVGSGLVPDHPLGRLYRDLLGIANQKLAAQADHFFLVVCGLPVEIKSSVINYKTFIDND